MAPFSLPAPSIIPLRLPTFGGSKSIDTNTKIQLLCETYLDHEIFFTLDGTRPQPYAGIVQGSKLIKYCSPFCLPAGKITIKAIAVNKNVHTMCSSVVTKNFEVLKIDSECKSKQNAKGKQTKKPKIKKKNGSFDKEKNLKETITIEDEQKSDAEIQRFNTNSLETEDMLDCFDQAFIGNSEFDTENSDPEDSIEDDSSFPINSDASANNNNVLKKSDINLCDVRIENDEKDSLSETIEEVHIHQNNVGECNVALVTDTVASADTQFCCLKCDLTLQQCVLCNTMNAVSSKFCIGCGKQLSRICSFCTEYNPSVATYCQYCGNKLNSRNVMLETLEKLDIGVMAKPESKNAATQMLPTVMEKSTQTICDSPVKKGPYLKRMHSPGRGYWHQQMDYICNNLKSHAYNNIEFRKEISEPILCDFKSAHITQEENSIKVTVVFSPLKDKNNLGVSDEAKSKHKKGEDV